MGLRIEYGLTYRIKEFLLHRTIAGILIVFMAAACIPNEKKPNILLILAEDVGFYDLGCYGDEIKTPNLDKLASEGLRVTQFNNCARCWSSRAALLAG